jgi:hypothetical protein
MDNGPKVTKLLQKLVENEEVLARLYTAYANVFLKKRAFWLELADEELKHAKMIQKLSSGNVPSVEIKANNFDMAIFQISLDFIADKQAQAETGNLSMKEAVTTALDIETGMLERGYFDVFTGDSPEFNRLLKILLKETEKHIETIRKELNRKRWFFF